MCTCFPLIVKMCMVLQYTWMLLIWPNQYIIFLDKNCHHSSHTPVYFEVEVFIEISPHKDWPLLNFSFEVLQKRFVLGLPYLPMNAPVIFLGFPSEGMRLIIWHKGRKIPHSTGYMNWKPEHTNNHMEVWKGFWYWKYYKRHCIWLCQNVTLIPNIDELKILLCP